jgi:hypothetical protein
LISLNCSNDIDYPDNPFFVDRGEPQFKKAWCYRSWWEQDCRTKPGQIRVMALDTDDGGQETIYNVVTWIRSLYLDVRIAICNNNKWALELQYTEDDPADKVFFGLCLIRFLSPDFIGVIPPYYSCRQFLAHLFLMAPHSLHMPLVDAYAAEGELFAKHNAICIRPKYGEPTFGRGKHAFWSTFNTRAWGKNKITDSFAKITCGIWAAEWLRFYEKWIETEDAQLDY